MTKLARRIKAFLNVGKSFARGYVPVSGRKSDSRLQALQRRLEEQNRKLRKVQQRVERQERQLTRLRQTPEKEVSGGNTEPPGTPPGERLREPLRVVHVSTHDAVGGAARAARRLHAGLLRMGHDSTMFVAHQKSSDPTVQVFQPTVSPGKRLERQGRRAEIQEDFARYEESRPEIYHIGDSFNDDRSPFGAEPLEQLPECDVVNLHVISGFIDHQAFFSSIPEHTPVVWTLHDMNSFTGGCHYDYGCGKHTANCGACPQLGSHDEEDLSRQSWRRKHEVYSQIDKDCLHVVGASRWLADEARRSSLLGSFPVTTIPYSLDTQTFAPRDRPDSRFSLDLPQDARVVLFLTDSIVTRRKGFALLAEALNGLKDVPGLLLVSIGNNPAVLENPPIVESIPHRHFDFIHDDHLISTIYSAADLFVIPSLQENLPQTTLEAMSCGTPSVGFDVGGIPDLVRPGVTGELIPVGDVGALRDGIRSLLKDEEKLAQLSANCRRVVVEEYAHDVQAGRYAELYRSLIGARAE